VPLRPHLSAAILAGGRATRFGGRDKSRLPVQGRPIINRQLDVLQQLTTDIAIIAANQERFAGLGVRVVADLIPGTGTLGGIYTALVSAAAERVIIVGCDLPFLHAGLLQALAGLAEGHDGAWVKTARGAEPLLACYQRAASERVKQRINEGELKASELNLALDMAELHGAELDAFGSVDWLLANVNTPEDLARLE
jgi:molybdenum cofactor guanylyltransferase